MLRVVAPLSLAFLLAQQPCEGTAIATGRRAALRSRAKSFEQAACDCSSCVGERRNEGGDGSVGFQCFPGKSDLDDCMQTGSASDWVVQSAKVLSYDRFCLYTCKPVLRNKIEAKVPCKMLNHEEITLSAQSPTFNGNEIVYKAHPMASVGPISRLVPLPQAQMFAMGGGAAASADPLAQLKNTFASIRKEEAESGGVGSPFELPSYAKAPPLCVCHCGKDAVNRMAQTPGGPHLHPPTVPKISWPSGPSPMTDAEPMEPPMPPPPPADLPPPAMPMGMGPVLQELPTIPEAPPEVTGRLDLQLVQASDAAAPSRSAVAAQSPAGAEETVSFMQYGQLKATSTGITCQCVC
eukprot:TRINITY_DN91753_c0_g1_i1.p1 TRINITY_DN91753_c0_g1~~TRINITY_DN91753_c0_g1_i1.p1  ORF type:complete len:351 (+),score=83.89 TRINITY_DN91753_c0_g1_i1:85-1137(+)